MEPALLLAAALVVAGIAGTVLPALPGVPLVFAGLFIAAWSDGFERVGPWTLALLALLVLVSFGIDLAGAALGLKRSGASRWALLGAVVGLLAGLSLGLVGLLIGPFLGAFGAEYLARRDWKQAGRAGVGAWIGLVLATALRLAVAFAMVGIFALAWMLGAPAAGS
ncbi:MAG: membrane protein [Acidobacteriota bacterium]